MNKILVIPDIHGRDFWKDAIEKYNNEVDKIIFLGDYLDPYLFDFDITNKDTIETNAIFNFKEIINAAKENPKIKLLIGNHDFHYIYSGYNGSRKILKYLNDIINIYKENIDLFSVCDETYINNTRYVFSHAGIMKKWLVNNNLDKNVNINEINSLINNPDILWQVSYSRGGRYYWGSCIWAHCTDILYEYNAHQNNFDFYQIFGHTYSRKEIILDNYAMLDCGHAFLLTDENEIVKI